MSDLYAVFQSDSGLLKGLLTDNFCHVCEATLLYESQRVSHYEVCEVVFCATIKFFQASSKGCSHISNIGFYVARGKSMHNVSGCTCRARTLK